MQSHLLVTIHRRVLPLSSLAAIFFVSLLIVSPLLLRASDLTPESVLSLVNADRSADGLQPLKLNAALNQAAMLKADDMFEKGYFSHNSPKGETPWQWVKQSGYQYQSAGENLAINYSSVEKQHAAWMKSATHRANILNGKYQDTGIAVKTGKMNGESVTVTVQMFGAPRGGAATPAAKQAPARPVARPAIMPAVQEVLIQPAAAPAPTTEPMPAVQTVDTTLTDSRLPAWMQWLPTSGQLSELEAWAFLAALVLFVSILAALPTVFVGEAMFGLYRYWRDSARQARPKPFVQPVSGKMLLSPGQFPPLLDAPKRRLI